MTELLEKMKNEQSCKIYTLSSTPKEYEKFAYQLKKDKSNGLDSSAINKLIMSTSIDYLESSPSVTILHDPCDIRKPYSKEMESIGQVRSLDGNTINGYRTFNSVAIGKKRLHLLGCVPYSSKEEDVDKKQIAFDQITSISKAFKEECPDMVLTHIIDREADDQEVFEKMDELGDRFVIRVKANRNSDVKYWNKKEQKEMSVKLINKELTHSFSITYEKFFHKGKVYQHAEAKFEYERHYIGNQWRYIVKVKLFSREGKAIFKQPMLLITNIEVDSDQMAQHIYYQYLKRAKIEGVFKFLKGSLGWEEFQIRDLIAIKNIILLCFFIGSYFYEMEDELTKNDSMICICQLGGGKGKVTRHYFLKGLENLYHFHKMNQLFKEQNLSQEEIKEMLKYLE